MEFFVVFGILFFIMPIIVSFILLSRLSDIRFSLNTIKKELIALKEAQQQATNKPRAASLKTAAPPYSHHNDDVTEADQTNVATPIVKESTQTEPSQQTTSIKPPQKAIPTHSIPVTPRPSPSKAKETIQKTSIEPAIPPAPTTPKKPSWLEKGLNKAWKWITGGNSVARVGVLVLFFGVSFLLKYAADNDMLPAEIRLAAAAIGGIVLLVLGWRLKDKNQDYGLLLQGAGIGMLYLTAFTTYYLYHFISVGFTFGLLVLISALATTLAIVQNAPVLAIVGFVGGYLTPIMVSTGNNNYITLFSYYALLNTAVATIAWFKSWRLLNLMAFGFTFIISGIWGGLSYFPENFTTTEPFLILFFLQFLSIAVLFALRQPPNLKGYIDGTLIFGTPIIAFGLQLKLVQPFEYGAAISSFIVGSFYVALATVVYKRLKDSLHLLAEVFLAIGVIFLSLAIPFAVDPNITAATWALEGAGLYWVGVRQQRLLIRVFALLLQVAAAIAFSQHNTTAMTNAGEAISTAFLNSLFIGSAMIAIGGIIIAWFSSQDFKGKHEKEGEFSALLFSWGISWWLIAGFVQVNKYFTALEHPNALLAFLTLTAIMMGLFTRKLQWSYSRYVSWAFIPTLAVAVLAVVKAGSHPAYAWGGLIWFVAFAVSAWILWEAEFNTPTNNDDDAKQLQKTVVHLLHNTTLLGFILIITWEGSWQITRHVAINNGWHLAWLPITAIALLWVIIRARIWPFMQYKASYNSLTGILLAMALVAWNLFSTYSTGSTEPLPWIPLFNVIDLVQIASILTLFVWWHDYKKDTTLPIQDWHRYALSGLIALAFLWLNVTIMRTVHHWVSIPYELSTLLQSPTVQTAFSILWTITSVLIMLFATHKTWKKLWLGGAALMAIVVIKLFIVDLAASGTVARIVSFIIVGLLMVAIGYFAPMPSEQKDEEPLDKE